MVQEIDQPVGNVVFGYPDFTEDAKKNCPKKGITLISAAMLGELLIAYWEKRIDTAGIAKIMISKTSITRVELST